MRMFEFHRPEDATSAIAAGAQANTAQQGADIRFLAGGTTLIDLMKLEVETPGQLLDINRLPFDTIEELPNGGLKNRGYSAQFRSCTPLESARRVRCTLAGDSVRGISAASKPGNDGRQPSSKNALHVLPR